MRELSALLEWPHGIARLGVILCVSLALVLGLVYFVRAVDRLGDDAARNAATNFDDREFAGGNSLVADKRALYEARGRIPEDGTTACWSGREPSKVRPSSPKPYIDQFARSFLMPRRPAPDAPWILCYGCDRDSLGVPANVVWENGAGIELLQVVE